MAYHRKLSEQGRAEIEAAVLAASQIPSEKELMARHGISRSLIQQIKRAIRAKLVSRGTKVHICAIEENQPDTAQSEQSLQVV